MGFAASGFLFLLNLALIPIIIHLIQRIRLKKISYSSLFFLTETKRETFSWLRLKEVLLLIFRTLFIFFLFFSLARPYLRKKLFFSASGGQYEACRVIILDDSYSMAADNIFNLAKEQAQDLIKQLKKGSEVAILTSSGSVKTDLTNNLIELGQILDTITVSYSANSLEIVFEAAINILFKSSAVGGLPRKEICLITDLQNRALLPLLNTLKNRPKSFEIIIIDVGKKNMENVGIEKIYLEPTLPTKDFPSKPRIKIKNFSAHSVKRNLSVVLTQDDSFLLNIKTEIALNPDEVKTIPFDIEIRNPGVYQAIASLSNDALPIDDTCFFTITVPEKIPLLLLYETAADVQYIEKALSTSIFEITTADIKTLRQQNLKRYKAIGLFSPSNLTYADWQRLGYYLLENNGLFIALNQEIKEPQWTRALGLNQNLSGKHIGVTTPGFVTIGQVNYSNPIMEIFQDINLSSAKFYSFWELDTFIPTQVLAYFTTQKPFLLQEPNKKIIIALTTFNTQTTDFMFKATFLPLIHRIFTYLTFPQITQEYLIDDTVNISVLTSGPLEIITPRTQFRQMPILDQGRPVIKFSETKVPGFYRIGKERFVINVLSQEGDLTRISEKVLKDQNITLTTDIKGKMTDLTTISLMLATLFLMLEIVLLII